MLTRNAIPKIKALFVCGSFNQTTQMHQIAEAPR